VIQTSFFYVGSIATVGSSSTVGTTAIGLVNVVHCSDVKASFLCDITNFGDECFVSFLGASEDP
jgi:hypothetical protein